MTTASGFFVRDLARISARGAQCGPDLRRREAAVLEEALLARPRLCIGRARAELAAKDLGRERVPVDFRGGERVAHSGFDDAALAQFLGDAHRPLAAGDPGTDENLDETLVVLQALLREPVQGFADDAGVEAARRQLALQLLATVLTTRERGQRPAARDDGGIVAQASASSSSSALAGAVCGRALARICASSSAASSGCSFR